MDIIMKNETGTDLDTSTFPGCQMWSQVFLAAFGALIQNGS